ncbi:MAG TPA: hypothetical protein VMG09_02830 [Bacteroidota bacterium]|nr:hypothetical protein [Bacteroidota bacterium]
MDKNDTSSVRILGLREGDALRKPVPYSYSLESGNQKLIVFGAAHFKPATDPQFVLMRSMWDEFKKLDGAKIAIVEPGMGPIGTRFEDAVAVHGEGGATEWFGLRDGIGLLCADIEYRELLPRLAERFDSSDVAYWVLTREMDIYFRRPLGGRTADEVLNSHLTRYRKMFNSIGVAGDRAWFDIKHAQVSGGKSVDDKEYWEYVTSWLGPQVFIDIIEAESAIRNNHIYGVVKHLWGLGHSLFVTYGASHAVQLEPALRALVAPIPNLLRRLTRLPR